MSAQKKRKKLATYESCPSPITAELLTHVPFATSHTNLDLSNRPTEGGRIPIKIGELNSWSSID